MMHPNSGVLATDAITAATCMGNRTQQATTQSLITTCIARLALLEQFWRSGIVRDVQPLYGQVT
jgi:hypothetical protein